MPICAIRIERSHTESVKSVGPIDEDHQSGGEKHDSPSLVSHVAEAEGVRVD